MNNYFIYRLVTAIKRRWGLLLFKLRTPHVALRGKGLISGIRCFNLGRGNTAIIDAGASLTDCNFFFKGNNNLLHIYSGCHFRGVAFHFENDNNYIEIGKDTTIEPSCRLEASEGKKIILGKDCMLSHNIHIRTTDSHSILDSEGHRTNIGADIIIGNHVWIGMQSLILKGTRIQDGCIIGARSMTTASLKTENGDLIVGSPARTIKKNLFWQRDRI